MNEETGILWTAIVRRVGAAIAKTSAASQHAETMRYGLFEGMLAYSTKQKKMLFFLCFLLSAPVISTRGPSAYGPSNRSMAKKSSAHNLHTLDDVAITHVKLVCHFRCDPCSVVLMTRNRHTRGPTAANAFDTRALSLFLFPFFTTQTDRIENRVMSAQADFLGAHNVQHECICRHSR